jgi:histidine triad (HIT) family protein
MVPTLFTRILQREIPANIIYEDELVFAFDDINPQAPIHKLIVPRQEIATINDLTLENLHVIGHMLGVAKNLARQFNIQAKGYRLVFNCNEHGGQTVDHIHLHLLGGRQMAWPPG